MLGAIAGDMIGSVYEAHPIKRKSFPLFQSGSQFTDDTVLTVAVAEVLLQDGDYVETYKRYFRRYPYQGFGGSFAQWAASEATEPYGSFGNGSAMRVSAVAWARDSWTAMLDEARRSAMVTHDHPEGIRGAQAAAAAVFLARQDKTKADLRHTIETEFGYDLSPSLDELRPAYSFDVSCQGSVPEAIISFLASEDYEDAIRNAISLGGDSDTMAAIAGGIAEAFYGGVPPSIKAEVHVRLDAALWDVVQRFAQRFSLPS
jgi:ADP-ribosylglycohydrolase